MIVTGVTISNLRYYLKAPKKIYLQLKKISTKTEWFLSTIKTSRMMNSIEMNMFVMIERIYSDHDLINCKGHLLQ